MLAAMMFTSALASASSICGDVNGSGSVTATDALAVLRSAVGQTIELLCAPPAGLLKTGQTTSYGAGTDGDLQKGAARSFTDNGDGTVTDNATGLMWEKKDASSGIHHLDNTYTWSTGSGNMDGTIVSVFLAALNSGGGFAGHSDWRVPNIVELQSLINYDSTDAGPPTDSVFKKDCVAGCTLTMCSCTRSFYYWSSSVTRAPGSAWYLDFGGGPTGGTSSHGAEVASIAVRAVRGGA